MERPLLRSLPMLGLGTLLLGLTGAPPPPVQDPAAPAAPRAVVILVEGVIQDATVALVNRGLREARRVHASHVVLELDTPGGVITSTRELVGLLSALRREDIKTVGYVPATALSAGTLLALACDQLVMGPMATVGAVTPVQLDPTGIRDISDSDVRAKILSAMRADIRALTERRGPSVALIAEAMVDPRLVLYDVLYRDAAGMERRKVTDVQGVTELEREGREIIRREELGPRPLTLTSRQALEFGVADAVVGDRETLLADTLGVDPSATMIIEPTWSEEFVAFLNAIKVFLLIGGAVLLYVELTSPGFGVPGALGLGCFLLFFLGSYFAGLAQWTEILLFTLGIGLILAEIFLFPGTIVAGILGVLAVLASLFLSFQTFTFPTTHMEGQVLVENVRTFTFTVVAVVVLTSLLSRFLPSIPGLRLLVQAPRGPVGSARGAAVDPALAGTDQALVGRRGSAVSMLRPAGKVDLGDGPLDVVAEGGYIPRGAAVVVVHVEGNRVVVEQAEEEPADGKGSGPESGQTLSLPLVALLLVIGFLAIVAEVFFPSFGVLSIIAAVATVGSIFLAFEHGREIGFLFIALVVGGVPTVLYFAFRLLPRTPLGRVLILSGPSFKTQGTGQAEELEAFLGKEGEAMNDLRPTGVARIDGRRIDVVTRGDLVEKGSRIKVVQVQGNRVVVAVTDLAEKE